MDGTAAQVEVAILVAVGLGLWRASTLRSYVIEKWSNEVEQIRASLDDRAVQSLIDMQAEIGALVIAEKGFDPVQASADPAQLADAIDLYRKCLRARRRLKTYTRLLIRIGPAITLTLILDIPAIALAFAYVSGPWDVATAAAVFRYTAIVLSAIACALALACILVNHLLSGVQVLASNAP